MLAVVGGGGEQRSSESWGAVGEETGRVEGFIRAPSKGSSSLLTVVLLKALASVSALSSALLQLWDTPAQEVREGRKKTQPTPIWSSWCQGLQTLLSERKKGLRLLCPEAD